MVDVRYVYGGPGTGKSTTLAHWAQQSAERHGVDKLLIASFTRAAAQELRSRDLGDGGDEKVGTLHAHCYRALGHPPIVDKDRGLLAQWNEQYPAWKLTAGLTVDQLEDHDELADGDKLRNQLEIYRAQMTTDQILDTEVQDFRTAWEGFKNDVGANDFTDLLEMALRDVPEHPAQPRIGILDEAQDCTALELAVWWQWAASMDYMVMGGDPDQTLYRFRGATPRAFLDHPIPSDHKHMLPRSYRLPRDVHAYAKAWIADTLGEREPMLFDHTGKAGSVRFHAALHPQNGAGVVDVLERALDKYPSVMVLASCAYILRQKDGIIPELRERGIPFGNPFAPERTEFNPLHRQGAVTTAERVLAYLRIRERGWTHAEFAQWAKLVRAKDVFQHGKAQEAQALTGTRVMNREEMGCYLRPDVFSAALSGDPEWLRRRVPDAKKTTLDYPLAVVKKRGLQGLAEKPKLIAGTVHSVKGGEAACVLVLPELSPSGQAEWDGHDPEAQDSVRRLLYVGMTRAKETLVLGGISQGGVDLPRRIPEGEGVLV